MKVRKVDCSKRLTATKIYYKSGQSYITNWEISYFQLGQVLLQIGAASFYYKLGQLLLQNGVTFLLQIGQVLLQIWAALFY